MRFIVFYNDHPKVKDFSVRVWHQFQEHPNFSGDMTHATFIKHYKIDAHSVACLGHILYNVTTKQWEFDKKRHLVVPPKYRMQILQSKTKVIEFMNLQYNDDEEMISFSLKEQKQVANMQRLSLLKRKSQGNSI